MYEQVFHFFGLRENPFHVSPDPRSYFSRRASDLALAELILGVEAPQAFIILTGEAGTGKTTLLNHFLDLLQEQHRSTSYVVHSRLKPVELFEIILRDFGVSCKTSNKRDLLATLRQWLIRRHAVGDSPVIVIDEAQALSLRTLAQLRLLLNLESAGSKLLHIVLAGQPMLEEELRRPELRHLNELVTFRCNLPPFSTEETPHFVESRLASAGAANVFAKESLEATHTYSQGIPRTVNLLCEHALIAAYAEQVKIISPEMIRRVAAEFDLTSETADAERSQLSARFMCLVHLRPDENPTQVASENMTAEGPKAETIIEEPVTPAVQPLVPRPSLEVVPTLILGETISSPVPTNPIVQPVTPAVQPLVPRPSPEVVPILIVEETTSSPVPTNPIVEPVTPAVQPLVPRPSLEVVPTLIVEETISSPVPTNLIVEPVTPAVQSLVPRPSPEVVPTLIVEETTSSPVPTNLIVEPAPAVQSLVPRPSPEVVPTLIVEETTSPVPTNPIVEPVAAAVPAFRRSVRLIPQPAPIEDPNHVPAKELPVGWQGPSLGERFVGYWKDVGRAFVHDWKELCAAYGPAQVAARKRR